MLFVDENLKEIDISTRNSVTLMCNLAGYNADATEISWSFEGQQIISGTNGYLVTVANRECPPYGTCSVGLLGITNLDGDNVGDYTCSFGNQSQSITLFQGILHVDLWTKCVSLLAQNSTVSRLCMSCLFASFSTLTFCTLSFCR